MENAARQMVANAGKALLKSHQSKLVIAPIMKNPTMMRGLAVAASGMLVTIGAKKLARPNKQPATAADMLVLLPIAIIVALSFAMITGEEPNKPLMIVPMPEMVM
eukprot:CAMPEP_0172926600 /NCGR_PEP_ID=MMETSP1075-20121228/215869_1 /TAXON_ID=2916 /ORGANISM="Ceratium fusus, Strain PA161109" /LENGTH=104 /DNA_ID=CAMNT_0013787697 /DNA_START=45 /DNA_END=359 /DNA_ORIENTATION=-